MIKRLLLMASVAVGLTACQSEELIPTVNPGEETSINFTAELSGETGKTRVGIEDTGDGTKADRCVLQIYEKQANEGYLEYGEQVMVGVTGGKATFSNVRVISGRTYKFVFWADKEENGDSKFYNTSNLANITIKGKYEVNNDERDAFYGIKDLTVNSTINEIVLLTRPFGQLNLTTNDITDVKEADRPNKVKVSYTMAGYTAFNAFDGKVVGEVSKATVSEVADVMDEEGGYELMDYLFAPDQEEMLVDFSTEFLRDGRTITTNSQTTNIPVRRNWRTNISGNFLTDGANFNVIISPEFNGEMSPKEFTTESDLNAGGSWVLSDRKDGSPYAIISLVDVDPVEDLHFTITQSKPLTILVGSDKEISKHITIRVAPDAQVDFVTYYDDVLGTHQSTVLSNLTLVSDSNKPSKVGFNSKKLTTVKNVTFDGLQFSEEGILFSEAVQNLDGLTIKNCSGTDLKKSFVKIAAKNSANVIISNNNISFNKAASEEASSKNARLDGAEIWYMNGGKFEFSDNIMNNGRCAVVTIPGKAEVSPDEILVENNLVRDNLDGAITVQFPDNKIIVRNNEVYSIKGAIVFMRFMKANDPDIEITDNYFNIYSGSTTYVICPLGYATSWGDNENGCSAKLVCKNNVKAGGMPFDWAGWFPANGGNLSKANPVTLLEGSDITKPYKN